MRITCRALALCFAALLSAQLCRAQGRQPDARITYQTVPNPPADLAPLPLALPELTLQTVSGKTLRLSDLRGRAVLLHFWATWCPPCRREVPALNRLSADLQGDNVTVIGLSVDEDTAAVRTFVRAYGVRYPVAFASDSLMAALGGIYGLPTSFIVARDGSVVERIVGLATPTRLQKLLLQPSRAR